MTADFLQRQLGNASTSSYSDRGSGSKLIENSTNGTIISCNGQVDKINHDLGDTAELDIKWEDLQIGERIGIGKNHILILDTILYYKFFFNS